jgi:ubiquinone/menaquinone biosynthesis methyltransferase
MSATAKCVFCAIIAGEQEAVIILETERLIAFLDHRPLFRGHTLLVPKLHVRLLSDLPADLVPEFFTTAQRLERAVEDGLGTDGSMILVNNVVSQSVPHLHLHVIPRNKRDGLRFWLGPRHPYDAAHPAQAYADKIKAALANLSGEKGSRRTVGGEGPSELSRCVRPAAPRIGENRMPAEFPGPNRFARELFAPLPARYDRLAELLSFGQNGRWRAAMVSRVLPADGVILDVASGTAGVAIQLAARSRAQVVGVDLTEQMLRQGLARVEAAGLRQRIALVAGRAEQLPFPDGHFDALTFTYLLRYVKDPQATLAELARVLKPGGTMASLEFCVPAGAVWHPAWWAYTRVALPAGGLLLGGREWLRVGRFLGPNISGHYRRYPVDWTVRAWEKAGLTDVGTRVMSLGGGLIMWGTRASR